MREIHWAVLGTGVIANEMATALEKNGKKLYAVGNRTYEKAVKFGEKYGIKKVYTDFNEMFTDPEVDVIYITTPHNTHIQFMKKAIENGKHILVEKSITLNSKELDEALELAKEKGVIVAEAMTIFHMPVYKELKKILESGKLGKVNLITMNFGSFKEYNMENRFFNRNLAGGTMLDIGVYALSFIRWFMDSKPDQLLSQMKAAPTGVDEQAGLLLTNKEGQMATVMLSLHSKQPKRGMVSCEKGYIEVMEYPRAWEAKIVDAESGEVQVIKAGVHEDALAYELSDMEKAIAGDVSCMHLDYTKDVMDLMTEFRKSWHFTYPEEALEAIVEAGLLSPSGRNIRPWELIVVQKKETLEKMSECRVGSAKMLAGASVAIVVIADPEKTDVWTEDCSIVMSNMHNMAHDLGLGSCWIQGRLRQAPDGRTTEEYLRDILGYPKEYCLEAVLSIGVPAVHPEGRKLSEVPEHKVHFEMYGKYENI